MHVRLSIITGASDIEGGVGFLRDQIVPQLHQQKGFRGAAASGDRAQRTVNILTMWETEADLDASESVADKARSDALKLIGGQVRVERYEQLVREIGTVPPGPGAKLHIRHVRMDPGVVDENLAYFCREVVPDMQATPGFLGVRMLMDRHTGEGRVGTMWADEDSLHGSLARTEERRENARSRGVEFGEEEQMDVLFSTLPIPGEVS